MRLTDMVKEYRKANNLTKIREGDSVALTRRMNILIDKFEKLYEAAGFGFSKEGDPILIKKSDPKAIFLRLISMSYVIIDWSVGSGWDFDKGFEEMHRKVMAKIKSEEGIKIDSAGNIQMPDVLEPTSLSNKRREK